VEEPEVNNDKINLVLAARHSSPTDPVVMPISMEQWRATVGSNNATHSHLLGKFIRKRSPRDLVSQFLSFIMTLFNPGAGLVPDKEGNVLAL
jgi:hypothetical protein